MTLKQIFVLVLILVLILLVSVSRTIDLGAISKGLSENLKNISGLFIKCEKPYIRHGSECCLDKNDNKICDIDEEEVSKPTPGKVIDKNLFVKPKIPAATLLGDCAPHFQKLVDLTGSFCHEGGSIGGSPIQDVYSCKVDVNYPDKAAACAPGTELNNTYGSAAGSTPKYSCYVAQEIGETSPPSGCPLNMASVVCAEGFVYDTTSNLAWTGGGSAWGCSYRCQAEPDPYVSNPNWPCTKKDYKPIGGGGGETCCAKW
jgi:hypothetical protein